ncbi:amino acid deaminase [Microbacterium sp. NPDC087589]|uniref:amino acid deaminase n=1 Tax=Microbacterium sp. NPDC087589 TaxID=3364191 RepID=UPI00380664DE
MSELDQLTAAATLAQTGTATAARAAIDALPWLRDSIEGDRAAARFDRWGRSTAIDENTRTAVIPRALFEELHERADLPASWPVGNAGLLHCYGYLLSLESTPYGLKRDRWVRDELALACGLQPDALRPWVGDTTLLARATSAAAAILQSPAASAVQAIDGRATRVAFSADRGPSALAYEVAPARESAPLLVTLFPVVDASSVLGEFRAARILRWNAG